MRLLLWLPCLIQLACAAPLDNAATHLVARQTSSPLKSKLPPYTISEVRCDGVQLVRRGQSISPGEQAYVKQRAKKTGEALQKWLDSTGETFRLNRMPTLAMVSSGGSYRAMLMGAGVVQAMDRRDTQEATGGLYQAMSYHSGLSGGSWLLTTMFGNGLDRISVLSKELWEKTLLKNGIYPLNTGSAPEKPFITNDMTTRSSFGFPVTVTEVWGRFIEWQTLRATDDKEKGSDTVFKMSSIRETRLFKEYEAPYPIMTALGMEKIQGSNCNAPDNATQYEMHPYEFGSWDEGIRAFTPMEFLGTKAEGGKSVAGSCVQDFDTFSLLSGSSSSKFNEQCGKSQLGIIKSVLDPLLKTAQNGTQNAIEDLYGRVPNPFKSSELTPKVASANELYLVDGGQANQNNPIWPFIQPAREVDAIIVSDNSADTDNNWPNGTEILHTYNEAQKAGLSRMPFIPDVATFVRKGLNKKATFFGCHEANKVTIIFLPNVQLANNGVEANQPSSRFDWTVKDIRGVIKNGNLVATQNGDKDWPLCLACGLTQSSRGIVPSKCDACLRHYCYENA